MQNKEYTEMQVRLDKVEDKLSPVTVATDEPRQRFISAPLKFRKTFSAGPFLVRETCTMFEVHLKTNNNKNKKKKLI